MGIWDQLVDCIVRPPRDIYTTEDLIGGTRGRFRVDYWNAVREDCTLLNKKGLKLECSHFIPSAVRGVDGNKLPCVIYAHCNSGSRRDCDEAIRVLIPLGVSVFAPDFAGSGMSEGQYVTLGADEVDDLECCVAHLRDTGRVSTLGLWGRSMGAVTALLYSQRDPSIAGVVVDSPFSRLTDLMMEIVQEQRWRIPRPLMRMAVAIMRRSVRKRAGVDIAAIAPLDLVPQSFTPAFFAHATGDTFVRSHHSQALHDAYAGDKNIVLFEGDHNSRRPSFFYNSVAIFFHNTLQLETQLVQGNRLSAEVLSSAQSWAMLQHDIIGPGDHSAPPRQDFPCVSGGPAEGDVQEALQQLQQQLQNGEGQGAGAGEAAAPHGSSSSSAMATESRHVPGAAGRPEAGALSVQAPQQQHQLSQRSSQRPLQPVASSIVDEEDDLDLQYALQMSLLDLGGASPLDQMGPQQGNGNGDASSAAAAAAGNAAAAAAGGAGAAMQDLQALAVLLAERRQLVQAQARLLQGGSAAPPLLQRSSPRAQDDEDSGSLVERSSVSISSNRSDGKREPLGPPSRTASASPLGPS